MAANEGKDRVHGEACAFIGCRVAEHALGKAMKMEKIIV